MEQTESPVCYVCCMTHCKAQSKTIAVWLMEQTEGRLYVIYAYDAQARTIAVWLMEQTEGLLCVMYAYMSAYDAQARTVAVWLMEQTEGLVDACMLHM